MDTKQVFIQPISNEEYRQRGIELSLLRLDLIHPLVSGNKWYKLRQNILLAEDRLCQTVLSFGGAFSNHLFALAHFCREKNLQSIGIVRGEELSSTSNETLKACARAGMQLHFVSRAEYRLKEKGATAQSFLGDKSVFCIPEGGNNEAGMAGCADILSFVSKSYTHIALPVGTGTTLLGMKSADEKARAYLGFAAVRQADAYTQVVAQSAQIFYDTDFGGFGKYNQVLVDFVRAFFQKEKIHLDLVYTAKMMYYIHQQILSEKYPAHSKILCLHTGGLQGNPSWLFPE